MMICMLVAFLNFASASASASASACASACASVSASACVWVSSWSRLLRLRRLPWPPTRICLMLMKVSVAQIKPKAWKSVKQIAICFLSHAAADRVRKRERERAEVRPHACRTSSTYIYIHYIQLSVHDIDLLIMLPRSPCLLTVVLGSYRFGLVFISIRFQFSKCHKAGLLHLVSWLCNQCSFYHKLIIF